MKHFFIVPARKNSKGLKNKNRLLIDKTVDFINSIKWNKETILTTDDDYFKNICKNNDYIFYKRSSKISNDDSSIKEVYLDLYKNFFQSKRESNVYLWLIYIPIVGRQIADFNKAYNHVKRSNSNIKSLCSFFPNIDHPFNSWKYIKNKKTMVKYINNDFYRRQDLPASYIHHHYISVTQLNYIKFVNSELIGKLTTPVFMSSKKREQIIEIDSLNDLKKI